MSIFKCKMCGGTIEFEPGATVGVCDSCGTRQTLPRLDDDKKANLYDRANHFRRNNDYDKAAGIYEQILNEDNTDAEAYWSLVLCRYGIEYVEDPATRRRIPTVNRTQFTSIYMDEDYKSALKYADGYQKAIYEAEAKAIDDIQKGILEISSKEEPFDVFICYKETDASGRRTQDSVLANDLYHQLTAEGFKVFFARITLEDKLGTAYEPYIFAALNSAKVMVVLGTRPEYFNAVWVKNEWSRYLALVKNSGGRKMLIPAYRDMDPYDLPEAFSHLQAQDMSKLGFMQDLIRGIKKIISAGAPKAAAVKAAAESTGNSATAPLLKRAFMFLEDGNWTSANEYCEKVLDLDPENAQAYLGKLMAELQVKTRESLADCEEPFDNRDNFSKVIRFGDEALQSEARGYIANIHYNHAVNAMEQAFSESTYKKAARAFQAIPGFRDAGRLAEECLEKAEICRKNAIYDSAISKMTGEKTAPYEEGIKILQTIPGWRDADARIRAGQQKIEEIQAKEEAARLEAERKAEERRIAEEKAEKKRRKIIAIVAPIVAACIALALLVNYVILPAVKYNDAVDLMEAGQYEEAIAAFEAMDGYKDSAEKIEECKIGIKDVAYDSAVALMEAGQYEEAIAVFKASNGYKDSAEKIEACKISIADGKYNNAVALMEAGQYEEAIAAFEALNGYRDSADKIPECHYDAAVALMESGKYREAAVAFWKAGDYSDARQQAAALLDQVAFRKNTIAAGYYHTVGLKADGTVVAVGYNKYGQCDVSGWTDIVAIAAGYYHTVGLKADGTVVAVGDNGSSKGNDPCNVSGWSDIVAIAAGGNHTVGLKADGTVVAVGDNGDGQCNVSGWTDIVAIAAGTSHTVGLKADSTVIAVGSNSSGQCDVSDWTDIVAIAAGYWHTVGLKADGTVVAVGDNGSSKGNDPCNVSGWTDIVAIAAGGLHTVGLKADSTVIAVGSNSSGQCDVSDWTDIVAIAAGYWHTVGLKADGTVVAVGYNKYGQCDVSGWTDIKIPNSGQS